ncbi:MAG: biotin/lipoyl-binding protein [Propionicimonas sp.]|uniref:biotin/lipoyl-binding protein n=1 Tax=Propionicimonas sp. TaxID=1955623 RepID=UPI002B1F4712|nr:biotin/lipoyl-binding protein [Propionicimonas sp.]MEA4944271.1 biotin/lipoyl-binding protein [Propionicimonas sp.]
MKHPRLRSLLVGGVSLTAVAAIGTVWATTSVAADARYETATAITGDVAQSYLATGAVSRAGVVEAAFGASGTVKKVTVAVGDEVAAGDVLATLDTTSLKLALLNAETDLAKAKATLYAARHPSSSSASSGASSSGKAHSSAGSSGSGSAASGGISSSDAAKLYEAIAAVNVATLNWSNPDQPTTCDAIYTALVNANEQTSDDNSDSDGTGGDSDSSDSGSSDNDSGNGDSGNGDSSNGDSGSTDSGSTDSGDSDSSDSGSNDSDAGSADSGTGSDTGDSGSSSSGDQDSGSGSESSDDSDSSDTGSTADDSSDQATALALVVDDITVDDIVACGEARQALVLANSVLADYYQQLLATGTIVTDDEAAAPTGDDAKTTSGSSSTSSKKSSSSSTSTSVSARAVAAAKADVLKAQQAVTDAETALANATLVAPVAGTVGLVGLSASGSSSAGTVTIVGEGTAVVSIEVPLATRALLSQGMAATVTPAGSMDSRTGSIGTISILETDGTAGDSPTYTTTVVVDDPDMTLKEGAQAAVEIVTRTSSGVVTVPASAVTPTGTGTGTVQVVETTSASSAETVTVQTGAVGGGRVEVTSGLTAGQLVVLSDRTLALPTGNTGQTQRAISAGSRR